MIEINLLPEELKKKKKKVEKARKPAVDLTKISLQSLPLIKIGAFFVGFLIILHIIVMSFAAMNRKSFVKLNKEYNEILPAKREADILKARLDVLRGKTGAIDELISRRYNWSGKLNALSDSIVPGIWLTELIFNEEAPGQAQQGSMIAVGANSKKVEKAEPRGVSGHVVLVGYTSSMGEQGAALVGKFIKSLKDNEDFFKDFSEIELGVIKSAKIENQEVMNFRITCKFK